MKDKSPRGFFGYRCFIIYYFASLRPPVQTHAALIQPAPASMIHFKTACCRISSNNVFLSLSTINESPRRQQFKFFKPHTARS